jgi:PHP family Zn ribbon phosphoesterase
MGNDSTISLVVEIIIMIALFVVIIFGVNTCSASKWNDGICPKCNERYELCAVYKGLKYYACPECGEEIERY